MTTPSKTEVRAASFGPAAALKSWRARATALSGLSELFSSWSEVCCNVLESEFRAGTTWGARLAAIQVTNAAAAILKTIINELVFLA